MMEDLKNSKIGCLDVEIIEPKRAETEMDEKVRNGVLEESFVPTGTFYLKTRFPPTSPTMYGETKVPDN